MRNLTIRGLVTPRLLGWMLGTASLVAIPAGDVAAGESLWLLRSADPAVLAPLAGNDIVFSRIEAGAAFAFCEDSGRERLLESGYELLLLDPDSASFDHFLVFTGDPPALGEVPPPLRLLYRGEGIAVVAAPAGEAERVAALGFEMAKLFRSPMRLVPRHGPRASFAPTLAAEAPIESLVAWVSVDSLDATVLALEQFGTRRATKHGGTRAALWIADKFRSYGIADVQVVQWDGTMAGNVVATIRGQVTPDNIYVVGGHYDSYVQNSDLEPGADDNASGTAGVLECARILAQYPFESTVRFIAFGGEELGLLGSEAYASAAAGHGDWIVGMFNLDMIGYRAPTSERDLDVISNLTSNWLLDATAAAAARFVPELPVKRGKLVSGSSDHASFWRHFYSAVFFHEDSRQASPYIHTINDVVGTSYNDSELALLTTRVLVATLAGLAGGPQVPVALESFEAQRRTDGVLLQWNLAPALRVNAGGIDVQRAVAAVGPFERVTPVTLSADGTEYLDATAALGQPLWYRLAITNLDGTTTLGPTLAVSPALAETRSRLLPVAWSDSRDAVLVRYRIGADAGPVRLSVHDVRGRLVRSLFAGRADPGEHLTGWDGRTNSGSIAARGVYLVLLQTQDARDARRVVWLQP